MNIRFFNLFLHRKSVDYVNLIIDIGNTLHKAAIFSEEGELLKLLKYRQLTVQRIALLFARYDITHAILSSVGSYNYDIERKIQEMRKENKTVKVASEKPKKGLFFNLFDKPKSNKGYDYDDDGGEF